MVVLIEDRLDEGFVLVRLDEITMLLLDLVDGILVPVRFDQVHIAQLQDVAEEHDKLQTNEIGRHDGRRLLVGKLVA
jgi:hypothetical protein